MTAPSITNHIASQVKARRKQRGWSLDRLAAATGVSKAMLGQIERRESSPTIATLWKIATGLECSFSAFLMASPGNAPGAQQPFEHDPDMQVKTLFPFSPATKIEMFEITLTNFHEQRSSAHQAGVTEHLYVTQGTVSIFSEGKWQTLNEGEQRLLHADQAHGYRDEAGCSRFITVIHYPDGKA
ncbi:helix-turn-helix domain-containing protein [Alteromonas sp. CYL-A6]|uniref:helix-turn-helix domain-containing protein n=1 Tax=Alteromonas nitratireducens TaxID=3390813 RepID=UPI0034B08D8C